MKVISNPTTAYSTYKVIIEGDSYTFTQRYNTRSASWYLDILTSSGEVIVLGRKLELYMPVVTRNLSLMPSGNITVLRVGSSKATEITRDNLYADGDYNLVYYTLEDIT